MKRRSGLTLIEVLVAMFIMSIGMIALLTLFPIGVLRMAQSIRDARCEQMGRNAFATAVMENVGADIDVVTNALDNTGAPIPDTFVNPSPKTAAGAPNFPNADPYAESYPILVDPVAYYQGGGEWVGGPGIEVLRRRPVEFIRRGGVTAGVLTTNYMRSFSLWDEIRFNSSLVAAVPPGTPQKIGAAVLRDPRFTSAYVLRRPQSGDKSVVDCTVVVYENRAVSALEEYVYQGNTFFNPGNSTIAIDYTAPTTILPELRPGNWIMDASFYLTSPPGAPVPTGSSRAFFYRIVAVEDFLVAGRKVRRFEVQSPIRGVDTTQPMTDPQFGWAGTSIVMVGVAEVFEKGLMRLP